MTGGSAGAFARRLADIRAVMFDVDGTLVVSDGPGGAGGDLMPRADEVIRRLRERGIRVVVYTNGTTHVPEYYAHELRKHGLPIDDGDLITPATVAASYLERQHPGARVLVLGGQGAGEPLLRRGIKVVGPDAAEIDVVLVAFDENIDGKKIEVSCQAIWAGAAFLATSMAPYYFRKGNRGVSLSSAVAVGIAHVTGTSPTLIGKPSTVSMEAVAAHTGVDIPQVLVVGDDVDVEIVMGRAAGAPTALVLSGTTGAKGREEIEQLDGDRRPDFVIPDIGHLFSLLPALAEQRGTSG